MLGPGRAPASCARACGKTFLSQFRNGHLVGRATRHDEQRSERELKKVLPDLCRGRVESLADRARLPYRHVEGPR